MKSPSGIGQGRLVALAALALLFTAFARLLSGLLTLLLALLRVALLLLALLILALLILAFPLLAFSWLV